MERIQQDK